jgi:FixJ family two-component response regulator
VSHAPLISIVDDDQSFRDSLKRLMKSVGYVVSTFSSAAEFLESPWVKQTRCLIADINMPGMTGVELYGHLIEAGCAIPTILITAYPDDSVRERALREGVLCYLGKPFRESVLICCVRSAIVGTQPPEESL